MSGEKNAHKRYIIEFLRPVWSEEREEWGSVLDSEQTMAVDLLETARWASKKFPKFEIIEIRRPMFD